MLEAMMRVLFGCILLGYVICASNDTILNNLIALDLPATAKFRLEGGTSKYNGRIEVYDGKEWYALYDEHFGNDEAKVLCKTLGFPYESAKIEPSEANGRSSANVWAVNIACVGNESSIIECGTNSVSITVPFANSSFPHVHCNSTDDTALPTTSRLYALNQTLSSSAAQGNDTNIARYCSGIRRGDYKEYSCVRTEVNRIGKEVQKIGTNVSSLAIAKALKALSSVTLVANKHSGLYGEEISKTVYVLDTIVNVSSKSIISEEETQSFIDTVGNLFDKRSYKGWQDLTQSTNGPSGLNTKEGTSTDLLEAVGKYADAVAKTLDETNQTERIVSSNNTIFLVANIDKPQSIQFPSSSMVQNGSITRSSASFYLDKKSTKGATSYSVVVYEDLVGIIPSTVVTSSNVTYQGVHELNSAVLAVQLHSNLTHQLPSPIVLHFKHIQRGYKDAKCMFWNEQRYGWDTTGCRKISSNSTTTACECDHLTNFAILMTPWNDKNISSKLIDVLSYVGCSISIVCLIITVASHLIHWRYLKPHFRTVILMHLSLALVLSYSLFLFGADKTGNKNVCTALASLLHYIYLAVFFIMLAECIDVAWVVLLPLKQQSRPKWTLPVAWVAPAFVVGLTIGLTHLHGYGTDSYCWLSKENGLIWAFIAPALLVILCNVTVLIRVIVALCQTKAMKAKSAADRVKSSVWCLLVLLPLTGFSWIIGIFDVNEDTQWMQYMFVICNTLQGCAIFLFHCVLNKQMIEAVRHRQRKRKGSAFKTSSKEKLSCLCIRVHSKPSSTSNTTSEISKTKV